MKWFRQTASPHQVAVSMIGAKPGHRVLVIGAGDASLAAQLGVVTGLNGRTVVLDPRDAAKPVVEAAAAREGALVEFIGAHPSSIPETDTGFDVVVFNRVIGPLSVWDRGGAAAEAFRVLRPGGRLVAIESASRPGLFALAARSLEPSASGPDLIALAQAAGFRAARVLAESEGQLFVEATRPRPATSPSLPPG